MRSNWRVVILAPAIAFSSVHAHVRMWEGTLTVPACEEGLPDPNPPFDQRFNYPLLLPDRMLAYHLTRLAQLDTSGK